MEFSQSKEKHQNNYFFYRSTKTSRDTLDKDIIGNLTTIIKILIMTFGPALAVYIGVTPDVVVTFLTACLTFGLAVIDAKYPNTIFTHTAPPIELSNTDDGVLNDEYTLPLDEEGNEDGE